MRAPLMRLGCLLSLLVGASASAVGTIVPNANATIDGNIDNSYPFIVGVGMRYQQVFSASQFMPVPMSIGAIALRNDATSGQAFTATISSIQIWLSTTAATPDGLNPTFAGNIGADNTQVYSGSLTLSSTNAVGPGNTHAFDVIINMQKPFYYDPRLGNLLLDVKNNSGADAFVGSEYLDAVDDDFNFDPVSRVWSYGDPNATSGNNDTVGLVVRFDGQPVPEPSSFAMTALGVALIAWRRRILLFRRAPS
jgi:hypothetical protein